MAEGERRLKAAEVTARLWVSEEDIRRKLTELGLPTTSANVRLVKDRLRAIAAAWASAALQDADAAVIEDWLEDEDQVGN